MAWEKDPEHREEDRSGAADGGTAKTAWDFSTGKLGLPVAIPSPVGYTMPHADSFPHRSAL